jgi:hypothetical protein
MVSPVDPKPRARLRPCLRPQASDAVAALGTVRRQEHHVAMKNERIPIVDLARKLNIKAPALIRLANKIGINVIRVAATLTPGQAYRLRNAVDAEKQQARLATQMAAPVPPQPAVSPRPARPTISRCDCCDYPFAHDEDERSQLCTECRDHHEQTDESIERKLTRLQAHAAMGYVRVAEYREANNKLVRERDEAYSKRDKWMRALVEIVVAHGPEEKGDGCVCGSKEFPCLTRRQLRHSNRGIYDRCEELEAMSEAEFNRVLYGDDYSFFQDWEDGVV